MAETTTGYCLRRSFSNPSEINSLDYPSQVDATHALGGSISFGRYMSETLDWEKWSAFTQNRYIEEAERYSKPGSVAKMKAYFESHYGSRFGANKKKNSAQNQKNDVSCTVDAQDTPNIDALSGSLALNPETVQSCIRESFAEDKPDVDVLSDSAAKLVDSCSVEELDNVDEINRPLGIQVTSFEDDNPIASISESSIKEDKAKHSEKNYTVSTTPKRKVVVKEKPEMEKLDLMSERNLGDYSVKKSKKSNMSKLSSSISRLATPIRCKKEGNDDPKSKVRKISSSLARLATPIRCKKEGNDDPKSEVRKISSSLARLAPIRCKKEGNDDPKSAVRKISSSLARLATPVRPRKDGNVTLSNRVSVKESTGSQKPTFQRLHMSVNVSSITPCKGGVGKVFTPLAKIRRDTFGASSTPRASVNSVSRHPSATPHSETRKTRVALEKSFDLSRKLDHKLKSTSAGNVKSSTPSSAIFASFSFRTEERAAKRREFFQKKLEKEAENLQPKNKAKLKLTSESRKSSQSMNLKADAAAYIRTSVLTDNKKKAKEISSTRQPPKCEAKSFSNLAQDKSSRPFHRGASSKPSSENSKISKKRHENASPNIL